MVSEHVHLVAILTCIRKHAAVCKDFTETNCVNSGL